MNHDLWSWLADEVRKDLETVSKNEDDTGYLSAQTRWERLDVLRKRITDLRIAASASKDLVSPDHPAWGEFATAHSRFDVLLANVTTLVRDADRNRVARLREITASAGDLAEAAE